MRRSVVFIISGLVVFQCSLHNSQLHNSAGPATWNRAPKQMRTSARGCFSAVRLPKYRDLLMANSGRLHQSIKNSKTNLHSLKILRILGLPDHLSRTIRSNDSSPRGKWHLNPNLQSWHGNWETLHGHVTPPNWTSVFTKPVNAVDEVEPSPTAGSSPWSFFTFHLLSRFNWPIWFSLAYSISRL